MRVSYFLLLAVMCGARYHKKTLHRFLSTDGTWHRKKTLYRFLSTDVTWYLILHTLLQPLYLHPPYRQGTFSCVEVGDVYFVVFL